jgi:hypothetical protein
VKSEIYSCDVRAHWAIILTRQLEVWADNGVRIYARNPAFAKRLKKLVSDFPAVWFNKGLVNIPEAEMMRFPLVEGWQNQTIAQRQYPLSTRDREVLDHLFGELHDQDRMEWSTKASPFAAPVFVVW